MIHINKQLKTFITVLGMLLLFPAFIDAQCPVRIVDISGTLPGPPPDGTSFGFDVAACPSGLPTGTIQINGVNFNHVACNPGPPAQDFYLTATPIGVPAMFTVDFGGAIGTCNYTMNGIITPVPTLSEWGLIVLALIVLSIGVVYATAPSVQLSNGQTVRSSVSLKNLPFEKASFFKFWAIIAVLSTIGFLSAMLFFGYELTSADPFGIVVSSAILGYIVMNLKLSKDTK